MRVTTAAATAGRVVGLAAIVVALTAAPAAAVPRIEKLEARTPGGLAAVDLDVSGSDPAGVLSGIRVDRLDGTGSVASTACRWLRGEASTASARAAARKLPRPFRRGAAVGFALPFPGAAVKRADLRVTVSSGGCGTATSEVAQDFSLTPADLKPPKETRSNGNGHGPRTAAVAVCPGADAVPVGRTRKLVRKAIVCLLNHERRAAGLRRLKGRRKLLRAAFGHSVDMNRREYFAHEGPGGPSLGERLRAVRYRAAVAGENIGAATGFLATARLTVAAWMRSPGHRANVLEPRFRHVGVGVATAYPAPPETPGGTFTTVFGARR